MIIIYYKSEKFSVHRMIRICNESSRESANEPKLVHRLLLIQADVLNKSNC